MSMPTENQETGKAVGAIVGGAAGTIVFAELGPAGSAVGGAIGK
jgi:phage tail tape-measure protein